ncbi:copper resistance protein CopC [Labedella phragmitis]|uniref:Copper resistance protein CopC n=1 Tax=Labedella phragmitis TaxID=2498849 RepID=A0A3S3ZSJ8_9MICO|nr:copper resistance CopC family protein [Labedella phragmitis]RWZ52746.1 copper resistance protein CopC [Labedella phragmitis]
MRLIESENMFSHTSPARPHSPRRLRLAAAATALGVLLAAGAAAAPAFAHDELVASTPAADDALDPAPTEVTLTFSDNILEVGIEVSVTDATGTEYVADTPVVDGPTVTVGLESDMPGGSYQTDWRVVSSDGHPISGTIPFTVTTPVPAEEPTTTATPDAEEPPVVATPSDEASESAAPPNEDASTDAGPTGGQIALIAGIVLAVLIVIAAALLIVARRRGTPSDVDRDARRDEI